MDHVYTMRKFPTPGAELFGKGRSNPHPVPGGGEWGISLIPALIWMEQATDIDGINLFGYVYCSIYTIAMHGPARRSSIVNHLVSGQVPGNEACNQVQVMRSFQDKIHEILSRFPPLSLPPLQLYNYTEFKLDSCYHASYIKFLQ